MSIVGFAVAGGRSQRMGRDKALLPWGETDLLGHTLCRLRVVAEEVCILAGPRARYGDRGVPVCVDPVPDAGPLAGVLAGLERARGRPGLFLGIDLPLVPPALLARLAELGAGFDAVVPVSPRGPQPLCALYGPACLGPVRRCLVGSDRSMTAFWADIRVREVQPVELAAFGDPAMLFFNVNGPEDYDRARASVV